MLSGSAYPLRLALPNMISSAVCPAPVSPKTNPVTQALSDPLNFRLAFPIIVAVSDKAPSSLSPQTGSIRLLSSDLLPLHPPLRRGEGCEDYTPALLAPRSLALHPQAGATT